MSDFNARIIEEFRANEGVVGGPFAGAPMVLLTTTGARSGEPRVSPLVCSTGEDGTLYVFGSKAGATTHPAWFHNLKADPRVTVEFGSERFDAVADEITGEERDAIFARQAVRMPQFAEYEQKAAGRTIPVVALRRSDLR